MKQLYSFLFIFFVFSGYVQAQKNNHPENKSETVSKTGAGTFEGYFEYGNYTLERILDEKVKYPKKVLKNINTEETIINFTLNHDRTLSNFKVIKKVKYKLTEQIIEALKQTTSWSPARINYKAIDREYQIKILITTSDGGKKRMVVLSIIPVKKL